MIGVSIGISLAPDDGKNPDELLKNADLALYRAKADGRGTYRFFETGMDARAQARRLLELDLRAALRRDEFEVYYQPIRDVASDMVVAFEALVRWNHPQRGLIAPINFIPLAEETGLIIQLGEWVLRQACPDAAGWSDDVGVAVNLSPVQFKNPNLVSSVKAALGVSGLPPLRLELEITESVLLQNSEATLATLHELRAFGVRISLDDFGTGYSSLSYLRSFPFDKIKIDRSFVSELASRDDSMAIVRAVTGLGRSLGIVTTAEGVETDAQFELLRREGCTQAQGYLFSKPRPAADVESDADTAGCARGGLARLRGASLAQCEMRAAERHHGAEAQRCNAGEHAGDRRHRAWRRGGLSGTCQDQHADRDQELPHPLRNLARDRAVHQLRGEIAAGKADGRNQPPGDRRACRHELACVSAPQPAEIEAVARAQHVHGERQQHPRDHGAGQNQAARKIIVSAMSRL